MSTPARHPNFQGPCDEVIARNPGEREFHQAWVVTADLLRRWWVASR